MWVGKVLKAIIESVSNMVIFPGSRKLYNSLKSRRVSWYFPKIAFEDL